MRIALIAAFALSLSGTVSAQDANKPEPVRELSLNGVDLGKTMLKLPSESIFKTEKSFVERFGNKEWREKPENKIDFLAEQVVLFEWHGSTFDRMGVEKKDGKVIFSYTPVSADTFGSNFRVFVIPAGSKFDVVTVKE
jgi:hypothetical protein